MNVLRGGRRGSPEKERKITGESLVGKARPDESSSKNTSSGKEGDSTDSTGKPQEGEPGGRGELRGRRGTLHD